MARHTERPEPVQDRPVEARGLRRRGLGVQRIIITAQAIDQRHFRARAEIADRIGSARWDRMRRRRLPRRAAETAIAAAEDCLRHGADQRAGRLVRDRASARLTDYVLLVPAALSDSTSCASRSAARCVPLRWTFLLSRFDK